MGSEARAQRLDRTSWHGVTVGLELAVMPGFMSGGQRDAIFGGADLGADQQLRWSRLGESNPGPTHYEGHVYVPTAPYQHL
jgi:hypothetical protein